MENYVRDLNSLMDIVMAKIPNWTLGHVDPSVCTRVREFSNSSESVYSFLMNTVQETFSCLFVYDTKNRIINVYDAADDVRIENLPIYLSKENFINAIPTIYLLYCDYYTTCASQTQQDKICVITPKNFYKFTQISQLREINFDL